MQYFLVLEVEMAWAIAITLQILVATAVGTVVSSIFFGLGWPFLGLLEKNLPEPTRRTRTKLGGRIALLVATMFFIADIVIALMPYAYRVFVYLIGVLGLQVMQISIGLA